MNRQKTGIVDPELAALASSIRQLQIQNLQSNVLQQQDILSPYAIVLESFDPAQETGTVEILDEERRQVVPLGKKAYRLFRERDSHSHGYLELMVVLSGSICNRVEGEAFVYQRGQGCLMNSQILHQEEPISRCEVLFVALQQEFLSELYAAMRNEKTRLRGATLTAFLQSVQDDSGTGSVQKNYLEFSPFSSAEAGLSGHTLLTVSAVEALRMRQPGCGYLARAAVLAFLNDLGDASRYTLQRISSTLNHAEFLVSKIDLLIRAAHGSIRVSELEEQLGYNGDYLNRIYRRQKGISISASCRESRMHDAKYLLRHSRMSMEEIMQTLGITSRGYFFSQFREAEGMTPAEYRKAHRG